MINAYIQIIVMLLGAFLLGMFVAWQYWKKKHKELQEEANKEREESARQIKALNEKVAELEKSVKESREEAEKLEQSEKESREAGEKLEKKNKRQEAKIGKLNKELDESKKKVADLQKEVEVLDGELVAAHDELYAGTKAPPAKKSSYYKYKDGKRYKASTLRAAEVAVEGKGDGRISMEDAKMIFDTISDGKQYTPVEKATMHYIRENFKWTDEADQLFRHWVSSWAAQDHDPEKVN